MTIYEIRRTSKSPNHTESIFTVTMTGIYVENPELGFFEHPKFKTHEQLKKHLEKMKSQGFEIIETSIEARK